ncbi:MAG: hypothetical protein AYK19_18010 [Theionarchaea archaeon DG-70-1]|nr:MAG: hypothetical protein AYK19_18010 [Theionarchaea archaeon DG-70-1]
MKKISKRFEELIARGKELYTDIPSPKEIEKNTKTLSDELYSKSVAWKLSTKNLLKQVYGESSEYYKLYMGGFGGDKYLGTESKYKISLVLGVLESAMEEYELGLTDNITHLLAIELFESILDQANQLLKKGFKDPAAILGRIIIESTLKDLCEKNSIEFKENEGASSINEKLKNEGVFTLHQFKICRVNVELGNTAAHGQFEKYSQRDVQKMLDYIEHSLLTM